MNYAKLLLIIPLLFMITGCGKGELPPDQEVTYEEVKEIIEETNPTGKVHGSCNMISTGSHCLDYIGSIWTEQQMRLNCQGAGEFSFNTCPYTEQGGCQATADTISETILWSYNYGGSPITADVLPFEQAACNTNPAAQWVLPEA